MARTGVAASRQLRSPSVELTSIAASATEAETDLHDAWQELRSRFQASRVSLTIQHRLTACVRDTLVWTDLLREVQALVLAEFNGPVFNRPPSSVSDELTRLSLELMRRPEVIAGDMSIWSQGVADFHRAHEQELRRELEEWQQRTAEYHRQQGPDHFLRMDRFSVVMKAVFLSIRALQDACFAAYVETTGGRAGRYTSLSDGLKRKDAFPRQLEVEVPGYTAWFLRFRDIRDKLKNGVTTGQGLSSPGPPWPHVAVHHVIEAPPQCDIYCTVSWTDVETALRESARMVRFVCARLPE